MGLFLKKKLKERKFALVGAILPGVSVLRPDNSNPQGQLVIEMRIGVELQIVHNGSCGLQLDGAVQLHELPEGEGAEYKLHITTVQIGVQLAGEQIGVGTGDINVTVRHHLKGIDAFFQCCIS